MFLTFREHELLLMRSDVIMHVGAKALKPLLVKVHKRCQAAGDLPSAAVGFLQAGRHFDDRFG